MIGGYLNPTEVGIYLVGGEVGSLASTELLEPITRAPFAGFSSARRSAENVTSAYLRAVSAAAVADAAGQRRYRIDRPALDAPGIR